MIRLEKLTKTYVLNGCTTCVADCINAVFPHQASIALLGRNGAGKSSLLRMIAGTMDPTSGRVISDCTISWPVGFSGGFHKQLTGAQNVRFIARVYGVDADILVQFVEDFAELKQHFYLPYHSYSSGMRSKLAFGVSMGIEFDIYLVDEVTSVGDVAFREKAAAVFKDRMANSGAIVVSHSMSVVRDICNVGAVLEDGKLAFYNDLDRAIYVHNQNMKNRDAR